MIYSHPHHVCSLIANESRRLFAPRNNRSESSVGQSIHHDNDARRLTVASRDAPFGGAERAGNELHDRQLVLLRRFYISHVAVTVGVTIASDTRA
jgi:hypothetical protein